MKTAMDRVGVDRGWQPMTREHFMSEVKGGSMYVGSPQTVAKKIAKTMQALGATRFDIVYGFGPVPAKDRRRMIELFGEKVIPMVKDILSNNN